MEGRNLWRIVRSHAIPVAGTIGLLLGFMGASLWVLPAMHHQAGWSYDMDFWNYLQLAHLADTGAFTAIYGQNSLMTTPGIVVVLAPIWWVVHAAGLSVSFGIALPRPTAWLLLGPCEVLISSPLLFAVDAVAQRLGASPKRRLVICAAEVYALYNVVLWGHPEDAVAVACLLYACLAASQERWSRCGWLIGAGVAFQPVILLAVPVLLFEAGLRRTAGLLVRAASPSAVLVLLPLTMNWSVTVQAFFGQATYPSLNRPTPWIGLAPSLGHIGYLGTNTVAAVGDGPCRLLAVVASVGIGYFFRRAVHDLGLLISVVALCLCLWCGFESVIAPYYVWPPIAAALLGIARAPRLRSASVLALALLADLASNADLHAEWVWWVLVASLAAMVAVSWAARSRATEAGSYDVARRLEPVAAAPDRA